MLLLEFFIFYPVFTSMFWLIGALFYYFKKEIHLAKKPEKHIQKHERITFIVPCYNESETIQQTVENVSSLSYPFKELIVVNDGSSDNSAEILNKLTDKFDFTFINLKKNQGKANALNRAVECAESAYIMIIDADTIIEDDAPYYMVENFRRFKNIGAVTGNPRIRNKSTLLGKIQTVEYASIIGSIKRAQLMNGFVNTVSGVFTLFDRKALNAVGNFDTDMITEDIAVSWKMHFKGYKIQYEPRALCWMLVPETIIGLMTQRIRWAQGGQEVLIRDARKMFKVKNPALWLLFMEQVLSIVWVGVIMFVLAYLLISINYLDYYFYAYNLNVVLLSAFILTFINIIQFSVSLYIDSRYEHKNIFMLIYLSWYPVMFWIINAVVTVAALPRALKRKKGDFATWTSPDRGNLKK